MKDGQEIQAVEFLQSRGYTVEPPPRFSVQEFLQARADDLIAQEGILAHIGSLLRSSIKNVEASEISLRRRRSDYRLGRYTARRLEISKWLRVYRDHPDYKRIDFTSWNNLVFVNDEVVSEASDRGEYGDC